MIRTTNALSSSIEADRTLLCSEGFERESLRLKGQLRSLRELAAGAIQLVGQGTYDALADFAGQLAVRVAEDFETFDQDALAAYLVESRSAEAPRARLARAGTGDHVTGSHDRHLRCPAVFHPEFDADVPALQQVEPGGRVAGAEQIVAGLVI